jgi:hypothetical protein
MEVDCKHTRTDVIARRDGVDYLCCRDCGQIFEAGDAEAALTADDDE